MKPPIKIALIGAIATVLGAGIAILPKLRKTEASTAIPNQQSHGSQSPVVSAQGSVTISYGENTEFNRSVEPPIFSHIESQIPYGYIVYSRNGSGAMESFYGEPISKVEGIPNEHSQDLILDFDVTNPNAMELRVSKIEVEVQQFLALHDARSEPVSGGGNTRRYFCSVRDKPGFYICKALNKDYDFIKIAKGELEHFGINVNTRAPGIYQLAVWIEYYAGTEQKRSKVGQVSRMVAFFQ